MENYFNSIEKNNLEKEQESLKIENFRPLSNNNFGRNKIIKKSFIIVEKKTPIKKSASSIFPSFETKNTFNDGKNTNSITNDLNATGKTNSINITSLFNKDINFTTLNEHSLNISSRNDLKARFQTIDVNNKSPVINNIDAQQKYLSKNFANLIRTNDFTPNLAKYDKRIILNLSQKCKEIETKYIKALKYYYQMENVYINEEKKKKDSEIILNNSIKESNLLKKNYEKMRLDNIHLNNALINARNEIDRLNVVIKNDQKDMLKKQDEYNKQLKIEENKRTRLRNIIKINERQMSILQEKISDSSLSKTQKLKKYKKMRQFMKEGVDEDEERKKDEEIIRLKSLIEELQHEYSNLQKSYKKNKENKKELLDAIKNKGKQYRFNNDNINLLFKTIEKQEQDGLLNYNLIKSKNIIIKDLKERSSDIFNIPHYSLPKNIRINSAQKISQKFKI